MWKWQKKLNKTGPKYVQQAPLLVVAGMPLLLGLKTYLKTPLQVHCTSVQYSIDLASKSYKKTGEK